MYLATIPVLFSLFLVVLTTSCGDHPYRFGQAGLPSEMDASDGIKKADVSNSSNGQKQVGVIMDNPAEVVAIEPVPTSPVVLLGTPRYVTADFSEGNVLIGFDKIKATDERYVIYRRGSDGKTPFMPIGEIADDGSRQERLVYFDGKVPKNAPLVQYRVQAVTNTGASRLSKIVSVELQ